MLLLSPPHFDLGKIGSPLRTLVFDQVRIQDREWGIIGRGKYKVHGEHPPVCPSPPPPPLIKSPWELLRKREENLRQEL